MTRSTLAGCALGAFVCALLALKFSAADTAFSTMLIVCLFRLFSRGVS